jgi:hypothetical protein
VEGKKEAEQEMIDKNEVLKVAKLLYAAEQREYKKGGHQTVVTWENAGVYYKVHDAKLAAARAVSRYFERKAKKVSNEIRRSRNRAG